ncbi:hypothetical protein ACH4UX_08980 [Streptomyces althioticus]|jgi:hypothetical protein|uniref:hypothetical protein n=1 Tax=Actinomycetes TaxID=1760 RepID=UPI000527C046|nr:MULTISPECIES: hypothetical protein [Actinomycetes]MBM4830432.1 hypothetical protein [Actinospica acidiphila]WTC24841.1 hypothetical protein OG872_20180 [Streptomyces althioticus]GGT66536.1 hypothetical protein GCM10010243_51820 [Streptomyces matensis]
MRKRSLFIAGGFLLAGTLSPLATAAPAQAAMSDICGGVIGDMFCLYYNSYQKGGATGTRGNVANWDNYGGTGYPMNFANWGLGTAGVGQKVKNNAASWANSGDRAGVSYYNSNYAGAYDVGNPNSKGQLVNTYNDNASFRWR